MPNTTNSLSSGGFKFGTAATNGTTSKASESASIAAPVGGFKFGATINSGQSTAASSGGGFKFGTTASKENTSAVSGSEGASLPSGGFKFGSASTETGTETNTSEVSKGFSFEVPNSNSTSSSGNKGTVAASGGGFQFGAKSDKPSAEGSVPPLLAPSGGFKFTVGVPAQDKSATETGNTEGFAFSTTSNSGKKPESSLPDTGTGGLAFSAKDNGSSTTPPLGSTASVPAGGFSFGQKPASTTEASGGLGTFKSDSSVPPSGGFKFEVGGAAKKSEDREAGGGGPGLAFGASAKSDAKVEFKPGLWSN